MLLSPPRANCMHNAFMGEETCCLQGDKVLIASFEIYEPVETLETSITEISIFPSKGSERKCCVVYCFLGPNSVVGRALTTGFKRKGSQNARAYHQASIAFPDHQH